jgi:hypothetical protein
MIGSVLDFAVIILFFNIVQHQKKSIKNLFSIFVVKPNFYNIRN